MKNRRSQIEKVSRLLQQRQEIIGQDLFLPGLTRREALYFASISHEGQSSPEPSLSSIQDDTVGFSEELVSSDQELPRSYKALHNEAIGCTRCILAESRTNVVFSDGVKDASVMVVGEAPGANEDKTGLPFVGAAGKFLDLLLATVDLSR